MNIEDLTWNNFQKKVTYASDVNAGNKLKISDGDFVKSLIQLKLINTIERLRINLNG